MKPLRHCRIAAARYGGVWSDYIVAHTFFDRTKAAFTAHGHRMFLHSDWAVAIAPGILGETLRNSDGVVLPMTQIASDHMVEDVGRVPGVSEWLERLPTLGFERSTRKVVRLRDMREDPLAGAARLYGGEPGDYAPLLAFMDGPMAFAGGDPRARLITHNAFGIFLLEERFGAVLESQGRMIPVRQFAEDLIVARYGLIPSPQDIGGELRIDPFVRGRSAGRGIATRKRQADASLETVSPVTAHFDNEEPFADVSETC